MCGVGGGGGVWVHWCGIGGKWGGAGKCALGKGVGGGGLSGWLLRGIYLF